MHIQYNTNIPHSVLTGDVYTHSTHWHTYTDDHRGQLIADVISIADHITHQTECQTPHYNKHLHQISPCYLTQCTTGYGGQLNTHYHQTTYLSSPQLTYDMTTDYNKTDGPLPTTRKQTGHNLQKTQSPLSLRPPYPPTYNTHCQQNFHKHHTDGRQTHRIKGQDA